MAKISIALIFCWGNTPPCRTSSRVSAFGIFWVEQSKMKVSATIETGPTMEAKHSPQSPNKKPKSACLCGLGQVEHAEPGGGDRQGGAGADDRLGQLEHAEPGGDDRQGGAGAGDRLVQVEPTEPGGGDRHGGTDAGDGLWQEVG